MIRNSHIFTFVIIFLAAAVILYLYFPFTADDSYITARYARNLIENGELAMNAGERICAFTSPLHTLGESLLYLITGSIIIPNKILALLSLAITLIVGIRIYRGDFRRQVIYYSFISLSPPVLMWTVGGLETPFLLLLVALTTFLFFSERLIKQKTLIVALISGLAFLTRFDSILFFAPVMVQSLLEEKSNRRRLAACALAVAPPIIWLCFSYYYYGDIFPTSYYRKAPQFTRKAIEANAKYIGQWLVYLNVASLALYIFFIRLRAGSKRSIIARTLKQKYGISVGVLLFLGYGLTMATTHMMFGLRFFVPYLPALYCLALEIIQRIDREPGAASLKRNSGLFYLIAGVSVVFLIFQAGYFLNKSVNGLSSLGEYRNLGIKSYYEGFLPALARSAVDIKKHYTEQAISRQRPLRLHTYAEGVTPYFLPDAYILGKLVSFRRHCPRLKKSDADYVMILQPRHGGLSRQLPGWNKSYEIISATTIEFDGSKQNFFVFYNPNPGTPELPRMFNDPCTKRLSRPAEAISPRSN